MKNFWIGFVILAMFWHTFTRGSDAENSASLFDHWLKAKYDYEIKGIDYVIPDPPLDLEE